MFSGTTTLPGHLLLSLSVQRSSFSLTSSFTFFSGVSLHTRAPADDLSLAHHIIIRPAAHRRASSAAQRRAVPFPGVPFRAVRYCAMLCVAVLCCAVRVFCFAYSLVHVVSSYQIPQLGAAQQRTAALAQRSAQPCGASPYRAVRYCAVLCRAVCRAALLNLHISFFLGSSFCCDFLHFFFCCCTKHDHTGSHNRLFSLAHQLSSAQQHGAVQCREVPTHNDWSITGMFLVVSILQWFTRYDF